jgi:hypothetical protein
MKNSFKDTIITDFEIMKSLEASARDFYLKVCADPKVKDELTLKVFNRIAADEQKHVETVDKIINIIKNNM